MPRKLLRVALVAAVLPALTPEISMAQTAKVASTVRTAAPAPVQKKGIAGLWQRIRGQKPEAGPTVGSAKVVRVSAELPAQAAAGADKQAFELEGNADVQMLRRESGRRRPTFNELPTNSAAPIEEALVQQDRAAFENTFPDDVPTGRRTRQVSNDVATAVEPEVAEIATAVAPGDVIESVISPTNGEADAYPIEAAAPPQDVTAAYNAPQGAVPQYNAVANEAAVNEAAPDDVSFATPVPARPAGRIMNGMNGGVPTYQTPQPYYGAAPGVSRVDGAMYPSPQPGIPQYVGTTMITNPALDPHEMLYAHRYRGLYGPFYHKTCRSWVLTPFGICKNEKRILMGTEVRVNYKSHIGPCALFFPPVSY